MLKCKNVGTHVSHMWLCLPSAFNPAVGPRVESLAGDPASPKAPAVPSNVAIASGEKSAAKQIGTYNAARMGIVPNEEPIPKVTTRRTNNNITAVVNLSPLNTPEVISTNASTEPVSFNICPYTDATSMTNAMVPINPIPSATILSPSLNGTTLNANINIKPVNAPIIKFSVKIWATNAATIATIVSACFLLKITFPVDDGSAIPSNPPAPGLATRSFR